MSTSGLLTMRRLSWFDFAQGVATEPIGFTVAVFPDAPTFPVLPSCRRAKRPARIDKIGTLAAPLVSALLGATALSAALRR